MLDELNNSPIIGKNSFCGTVLAFLFLISFISLLINFGLFLLLILCQAVIIFLDATKIREENGNEGPNPIIYGICGFVFWIVVVPYYIIYRKKFDNEEIIHKQATTPPSKGYEAKPKALQKVLKKENQQIKSIESIQSKTNKPNESPSIFTPQPLTISKNTTNSNTSYNHQIKVKITTEEIIPLKSEVMTWAGNSKEIRIQNYLIPNPLLYWSTSPVENTEASCINLNLPIGKPISEAKGALGYWPRYSSISSDQRANYLLWLSSGKYSELSDIGYAFLFFYGLEHRAIIEKKDISTIVQEVNLLLKELTISGSFNSYLSSFLAYIAAKHLPDISDDDFHTFFPDYFNLSYEQVLVILAWHTDHKKTIPWEIAYSLANTISDTPKSVISQKLSTEFKQLFEVKFKTAYPDGLVFEPSLRKFRLEYRPASPSLLPYYQSYSKERRIEGIEISNPLGKKSQFKNIFSFWNETIEELKPAARKLGKDESELTPQAYQALPDTLKQEIDHPDKKKWDFVFTSSNHEEESTIISISSLTTLNHIEKRDRLTPTQSNQLFITARDVGYILIPDPRITSIPYRWDDEVVIYPLPNKKTFTSESYPSIAFILELGMSIALSDESFSSEEQEQLDRFIFGSFELTNFDVVCLKQYQKFLILNPPSLEKLGTRLKEHLTDNNRFVIAEFLRDMASADGMLKSNEYKALNKIYKSMGLEKDAIQSLFPPKPLKSLPDREGEVDDEHKDTGIVIDYGKVKKIIDETQESQKSVNDAINPEESNDDVEPNNNQSFEKDTTSSDSSNDRKSEEDKLNHKYISVLKDLIIADSFSKAELQQICRNYGIMMDAMVEEINTWTEDNYGDYLFEIIEDNEIVFNSDIRSKISEFLT